MAAKPARKFIALYTDCGDDRQLKTIGGEEGSLAVCDSLEKAKQEASIHADERISGGDDPCDYAIAEIVARGRASEIVWK